MASPAVFEILRANSIGGHDFDLSWSRNNIGQVAI